MTTGPYKCDRTFQYEIIVQLKESTTKWINFGSQGQVWDTCANISRLAFDMFEALT